MRGPACDIRTSHASFPIHCELVRPPRLRARNPKALTLSQLAALPSAPRPPACGPSPRQCAFAKDPPLNDRPLTTIWSVILALCLKPKLVTFLHTLTPPGNHQLLVRPVSVCAHQICVQSSPTNQPQVLNFCCRSSAYLALGPRLHFQRPTPPPVVELWFRPNKAAGLTTLRGSKDTKEGRNNLIGSQSIQMLKIRESLEEKLRQKGVFSSITRKSVRNRSHLQTANKQLETFDDFVDETMEIDGLVNGTRNGNAQRSNSSKLSQHLTL